MRYLLTITAALLSAAALAQSPAAEPDHAAHHPPGASAPAPAPAPPAAKRPEPPVSRAQADATMKSMRAMHDKMMAAKTPEERQALMADHMKAMQDGMAMMGRMKGGNPGGGMGGMGAAGGGMGGGMAMNPETMGMRMDMMEMMMQMMMDREAARMPASK
jgi:hypothetical protein